MSSTTSATSIEGSICDKTLQLQSIAKLLDCVAAAADSASLEPSLSGALYYLGEQVVRLADEIDTLYLAGKRTAALETEAAS